MAYTYNISTSKEDKKSTICLSTCHILFSIINLFVSTFLVAHIYSQTANIFDYAVNVGIYNLTTYAVMMLAYFLFSLWVDKSNRIWCYRLANLITAGLVVFTIFYGENLAQYVWLAGVLYGLSHAAYYASYNVLKQEMVSRNTIGKYTLILEVLTKIVNIVFPILLGMLIEVSTFATVAIYVCVICLIQIFITFFINAQRPAGSGFNVVEYIKQIKQNPEFCKKIKIVYLICLFYGLTSIVSSLASIFIMVEFGSSFSLGAITSVGAVASIITVIALSKFSHPGDREWIYILSAILILVSAALFLIIPNNITVIVYNIVLTLGNAVNSLTFELYRNKNLKEAGLYQYIAEHQCVVETIFQIVRCLSFTLLILFALIKNYLIFQIMFAVFVTVFSLTSIMIMRYETKVYEENNTEQSDQNKQ